MVPIEALPILGMSLLVLDDYLIIEKTDPEENVKKNLATFLNKIPYDFIFSSPLLKRIIRISFFETYLHALRASGISLIASGLIMKPLSNESKLSISSVIKIYSCFFLVMTLVRIGFTYNRELKRFEEERDVWVSDKKKIGNTI